MHSGAALSFLQRRSDMKDELKPLELEIEVEELEPIRALSDTSYPF